MGDVQVGQIWDENSGYAHIRITNLATVHGEPYVDYVYLRTGYDDSDQFGMTVSELKRTFRLREGPKDTPLDPAAVKAGDTVTLYIATSSMEQPVKPYTVAGEVYEYAGQLMAGGWPIGNHPSVTLTAHTPGSEPEPYPQGLYVATVDGVPDVRVQYADPEDSLPWRTLGRLFDGRVWFQEDEVTDVRPLVVIDPAKVQWGALSKAYDDAYYETDSSQAAIRAVLSTLGIKLPDSPGRPDSDMPVPGFYVVHPNENPGSSWSGVIDMNGDFRGEEDGFYRAADAGHYTVASRLVALDPATAREALENNGWGENETNEILHELRLED